MLVMTLTLLQLAKSFPINYLIASVPNEGSAEVNMHLA